MKRRMKWLVFAGLLAVLLFSFALAEEMVWAPVSWSEITEEDVILITMTRDGKTWGLPSAKDDKTAPAGEVLTVSANRITTDGVGNLGWTRKASGTAYTFTSAAGGVLYLNNTNNGVRVYSGTDSTVTAPAEANTQFILKDDYLYNEATTRYVGVYMTKPDWRCYTTIATGSNITGQTLTFWKEAGEEPADKRYSAEIAACENGSAEIAEYEEAGYAADTVLHLLVYPEEGYRLTSLSWVKSGDAEVHTLGNGDLDEDGAYVMSMPAANITITAVFEEANAWSRLQAAIDECEEGGTVTMTEDVKADNMNTALTFMADREMTLDLNGHTIDRGLEEAEANGSALMVGGVLYIEDSAGGGIITGGNNSGSGGGIATMEAAIVVLRGGKITGNKANLGGGANLTAWVDLTIDGAEITGNTSVRHGGGVYVEEDSFLTLSGGCISNNTAGKNGGAVYAGQYTTFDMTDGTIEGNQAEHSAVLRMLENGCFTFSGGRIIGNTSTVNPGQSLYVVSGATFNIQDKPYIAGNMGVDVSGEAVETNIFLQKECTLLVKGALEEEALLGITTVEEPTVEDAVVLTSGWESQGNTSVFESDAGYFVTELGKEVVAFAADPGDVFGITVAQGIPHGTVTADANRARAGDTVTLTMTPDYGYRVDQLQVRCGDQTVAAENGQFIMPAGDVNVTATFKSVLQNVDYVDENGKTQTIQAVPLMSSDTEMPAGAYAVLENISLTDGPLFQGDSILILGDGAQMKTTGVVGALASTGNLTVYGQKAGTGSYAAQSEHGWPVRASGIYTHVGGSASAVGGVAGILGTKGVVIRGGSIDARGSSYGLESSRGDIEISGGKVVAEADNQIGQGIYARYNVLISGGDVKAIYDPSKADDIGTACGIRADVGGTLTLTWGDAGTRVFATDYGSNPTLKKAFIAEETGKVFAAAESVDGALLAGLTLVGEDPRVDIPTAAAGLVWTGAEQQGVPDGEFYTLSGEKAADAGSYTAVAKLADGYQWSDGTRADQEIAWSIAKAEREAPEAPAAESVGVDTVTLKAGEGYEYRLGSGEWQSSNVFAGLVKNTEYTLYQRWAETANQLASEASEGLVVRTAKPAISVNVTFKVENGAWDDGKTEDRTVVLSGLEGDELKLTDEQMPDVGTKPADGYKGGAWDVMPDTETAITKDTTYTYTYLAREKYSVTVSNDGNGTGTASPASGVEGTAVTLSAAPAEGYQFAEWQVVSGGVAVKDNQFTIGTENVEIRAVFKKLGKLETEVICKAGAPAVTAANLAEVAAELVTPEEIAAGVKVWMEVSQLKEDDLSNEEKNLADGKLGDLEAKAGIWVDISLYKQVSGQARTAVTQTKTNLKLSVKVPDSMKKDGRTCMLIRLHGGKADVLATGQGDTLSGESNLFSTYLIGYKDKVVPTPTVTPTAVPTSAPTVVPKTGDESTPWVWVALAVVGLGGLVCLGVLISKKKK